MPCLQDLGWLRAQSSSVPASSPVFEAQGHYRLCGLAGVDRSICYPQQLSSLSFSIRCPCREGADEWMTTQGQERGGREPCQHPLQKWVSPGWAARGAAGAMRRPGCLSPLSGPFTPLARREGGVDLGRCFPEEKLETIAISSNQSEMCCWLRGGEGPLWEQSDLLRMARGSREMGDVGGGALGHLGAVHVRPKSGEKGLAWARSFSAPLLSLG